MIARPLYVYGLCVTLLVLVSAHMKDPWFGTSACTGVTRHNSKCMNWLHGIHCLIANIAGRYQYTDHLIELGRCGTSGVVPAKIQQNQDSSNIAGVGIPVEWTP